MKPRVRVLDTSAFIYCPFSLEGFTVKEVVEEAKSHITKLKCGLPTVRVLEPSRESLEEVDSILRESHDRLSETDKKLVALALDLRKEYLPVIVTDDYSIQNVCKLLGIEFSSLTTAGIKKVRKWLLYCPFCGRTFSSSTKVCKICGTGLRRKPYSPKFKE